MKLNKSTIRWFEREQKEYGTEVALYNLIWELASNILHGIGVKQIKTSDKYKKYKS